MPITPALEPDEVLLGNFEYMASLDERLSPRYAPPFALAVTSRALLIARQQVFGSSRGWAVERLPLAEVREVRIEPLRPWPWWALALLLIYMGGAGTYRMLMQDLREGLQIDPFALSELVLGFVLPFVARDRHALVIERADFTMRWKPPFVFREGAKRRDAFLSAVAAGVRRAGVHVDDQRPPKLVVGVSIPPASP
ncbi:MAG TPA: hypothetical protein VJ276_21890 [Thermoanaerobaculia bacterium]|nr:hypothetical protein [Thermoanaerobaculia bacterium]